MIVFGLTAKNRKFEFRAVIPVIIRKPHILHMNLRTDIIIHAFAFLHLAVALGCRLADINDEIMLTLLSVLMVTLLCVKMNARMEIIVSSIILTNVAGYVLGVYGARLVGLLSGSALLTHSVSTFMTTEVIGWCTFLLLKASVRWKIPARTGTVPPPTGKITRKHIFLLSAVIALIIAIRAAISLLFSNGPEYSLGDIVLMLVSRSWMTVVMLGLLLLLVRYIRQHDWSTAAKSGIVMGACLVMALLAVLAVSLDSSYGPAFSFSFGESVRIFTVAATLELIGFSAVYITDYAIGLKEAVKAERDKANNAEFQYVRLKQQVNPHFLFNSLNILDCLVIDGKTAQASTYIHKLAGIYRYMLRYDDRTTVSLEDEMNFVGMYADLLKVRFGNGFTLETGIPERLMSGHVIPCSVQMLLENAIKHNRTGEGHPLKIRISAEGSELTVWNELRPKLNSGESTRVGLDYLTRQYRDLYGKDVKVSSDGNAFAVTIPVLDAGAKRC